jgi:hypothetical protein
VWAGVDSAEEQDSAQVWHLELTDDIRAKCDNYLLLRHIHRPYQTQSFDAGEDLISL